MANANQLKALIRSHYKNESERFTTFVLQIAAHEAKIGHTALANDLRKIVDKHKLNKPKLKPINQDFLGLVLEKNPFEKLANLIVSDDLSEKIRRIIAEYIQRDKLHRFDLTNRRKVLLSGPPGTGKTMTASVVANELSLPLYIILMDKMVTKYMGETSAKLRQVFDLIENRQGVYLFDEFDAIGTHRTRDNDVGEMRRVLNSFLQFIEFDQSESIIIAATNNIELLDYALFRRFDDVIQYKLPSEHEKLILIKERLANYIGKNDLNQLISKFDNLSHSEITKICEDAIKDTILNDRKHINLNKLDKIIQDRKLIYQN